ncbi:hypothetical protein D6789_00565 [Candidatus Woesearchaeota archaeon]|nr:MAG: hypothetical protein D6789_00565 [Candidatus Woesearchaeota archaeon]
MELLAAILIGACGFLLRLLYSAGETSDEWVSLWLIRREACFSRPSYAVPDSLIEGTYDYPIGFHWLLSRIPERFSILAARFLNIIPDLLHGLALYLFVRWATESVFLSLFALAYYLTLPVLLPTTPRMKAIKARAFGTIPVSCFLLGVYLGSAVHHAFFLLAAAGVWLAAYSSLFAYQATLFFGVLLSIFLPSWWPVLIVAVVVSAGLLFPALQIRNPLLFWWRHKRWYMRNIRSKSPAANRSKLSLFLLPYYLVRRPRDAGNLFFYDSPLLIGLYSTPLVFIILWFVLTNNTVQTLLSTDPLTHFLWAVTASSLVLFGATMLPGLLIFGEAERYFEYSAAFFVALFTLLQNQLALLSVQAMGFLLLWNCTVLLLLLVFLNYRRILSTTPLQDEQELREVAEKLKTLSHARVASLPIKLSYLLSALTMHRKQRKRGRQGPTFYYRFITREGDRSFSYFECDLETLNTFSGTPQRLQELYGITHLVIDKNYVAKRKSAFIEEAIRLPKVYETQRYTIVALTRRGGNACAES